MDEIDRCFEAFWHDLGSLLLVESDLHGSVHGVESTKSFLAVCRPWMGSLERVLAAL